MKFNLADSITTNTVTGREREYKVVAHSNDSSHSINLLESEEMGFKVGGYIEPKPLDDIVRTKVVPMSPTISNDPPSYDTVIAQQKEERKLIGALLLKTSHLFGMHPFKDSYTCKGDVCEKRSWRDRLCPLDFILCVINLLVIFNHLRCQVMIPLRNDDPGSRTKSLFTAENAELLMKAMDAILPMICVLGMIFTSYHMHNLLRKLTDTQFSVFQKECKVRRWRIILYIINFFFILGALLEIPQNIMKETKGQNASDILDKPLKEIENVPDQIMMFVDRYYFPIINFGVVKIPQLFIMMISIRIALMFRISTSILTCRRQLTQEILHGYFNQLLEMIDVLQSLECCFNKLILAIVTTSVIKIIFSTYVTIQQLIGSSGSSEFSIFMSNDVNNETDPGILVSFAQTLGSTYTVLSMLLNIFWTIIFLIPCIWCNEESRQALPVLTNSLVQKDAKFMKDQIIQKLNDHTWGLTLGKFVKVDRTFAISLISLIFTVVVVWLQLSPDDED